MAIKIKRSTGDLAPASLAAGQLAYTEGAANGGTLYYGEIGGVVREIGGRKYVDKLNGIEVGAQVNTVTSVAGRTGAVTIASGDVSGLTAAIQAVSINALSEDATPQLAGSLDVNGFAITSSITNTDILLTPNGTGRVNLSNQLFPNADGTSGQYLKTDGAGVLSWATVDTSIDSADVIAALGYTPENAANKGANNGYASLDSSGLVPASQLPSYVDDVLEYANLAAFPATGVSGKIYVTADTSKSYRWSGTVYAEIVSSPGTTDVITEGSTNLYYTDARARAAISANGSISYDSSTGVISYTTPDLSVYATTASLSAVAISGTYGDILNTPTALSAFTNDSGFITEIVQDATPQLSGDLDVQARAIVTSAPNGDITLTPDVAGVVRITAGNGIALPAGASQIYNSSGASVAFGDNVTQGGSLTLIGGTDVILYPGSGDVKSYKSIVFVDDTAAMSLASAAGGEIQFGAASSGGQVSIIAGSSGAVSITGGTGGVQINSLSYPTADGTANQVLTTNGSGVLSWATQASGVTEFTGLTDTPAAFTGAAGYYVKVNAGATALEFSQDVDDGTF